MRVFILLVLTLGIAILLALFPEAAQEELRIEAFGWILETQQGTFVLALLLLLVLLWAVRHLVGALLAGPSHVWQALRLGGKKRRETHLREGLAQLIDMRRDLGAKAFRKSSGILPDWGTALLRTLTKPAAEQVLADGDPLNIALAARIVTNPDARPRPDVAKRKAALEAWLRVHPGAPLAYARLIDLAEEEGDWHALVELLEQAWEKGEQSAASVKPRLARAYAALAHEEPTQALEYLRKAHRMLPHDKDIVLALGRAQLANEDDRAARQLWSAHLEQHDDADVAAALFDLLSKDPLKAYRRMDKEDTRRMNAASQWLRAQLAHAADLTGLANEHMQTLIEQHASALAWRTRGDWHADKGEWQQAAHCYRQALGRGEARLPDKRQGLV